MNHANAKHDRRHRRIRHGEQGLCDIGLLGAEETVGLLIDIPMNKRSYGFTLIELMVTLAVMALLLMVGLPRHGDLAAEQQLRASAEGIQAGLQLARAEALRRNVPVRFQLVDTLTAGVRPRR